MPTTTKNSAYTGGAGGSPSSALTTELNSLGNASLSSASAALDFTTSRPLWIDLWLTIAAQGSARGTGAFIEILYLGSIDNGTTYGSNVRGVARSIFSFDLDAATTARELHQLGIRIPPGKCKLSLYNGTGQALAASGNTLKYDTYSLESA